MTLQDSVLYSVADSVRYSPATTVYRSVQAAVSSATYYPVNSFVYDSAWYVAWGAARDAVYVCVYEKINERL
jgi:hypothetical protein